MICSESFKKFCNFRILSILFLGFSAGIPLALTGATLSMWLARIDIDVKAIGLFSLVAVPYSLKFLWSSIFDYIKLPYFSEKFGLRKSWLLLMQICLIFSIIGLGLSSPRENIIITAILALFVAFFSASQDIVIDALRIEILEKDEQALGASMYVYGYRIAMLVSGAGALLLADHIEWKKVFIFMAFTIFIGIFAVFFVEESQHSKERLKNLQPVKWSFKLCNWLLFFVFIIGFVGYSENVQALLIYYSKVINVILLAIALIITLFLHIKKEYVKSLLPEPIKDFCSKTNWLYILLFIIFYKFTDSLLISMQSKFYVDMGFSNSEIAYITKGFGFFMTLAGLFVGGVIYYRIGTFKSLLLSGILQILSNLFFIWIVKTNHNLYVLTTVIAIENFTGAINNVVIIAYLSSLCNIAYTATQYALLSSLSTVGRTLLSAPAGYIVADLGWVNFIVITALAGVPAILLILKIFKKDFANAKI